MLIICCATHAVLAAVASTGPTPDINQLDGVLAELAPSQTLLHLVGDAGFDSGPNHRLLRDEHGIRSTIPPEHGRPPNDPNTLPTDKYRRLMKTRFNKNAYRKRPQVETVFSMLKRNFGSALRARTHWGRNRDLFLRVLTHNIALIFLRVFYRARTSPFLSSVLFYRLLNRGGARISLASTDGSASPVPGRVRFADPRNLPMDRRGGCAKPYRPRDSHGQTGRRP